MDLDREPDERSVDPRTAARLAGWSYVALFVIGLFANFFVRERLVETNDAATTLGNLAQSEALMRLAILGFVVAFVLDVVVAWALFHVFRGAQPGLSPLAAWFRIVYTIFLGVGVVFLFAALEFVSGSSYVDALGPAARQGHAMLALDAFNATWLVGLTCFGVHLAILGAMVIRSQVASKALGVALLLAGGAYVFDTLAYSLLSTYGDHEVVFTAIVALPAVVAEAALAVWLLTRAGRSVDIARRRTPALAGV